jgi:hypothetical protein
MNTKDSSLIDELGGTVAVAAHCGVRSQAVSQWRKKGIPRPWKIVLENHAKGLSKPAQPPQPNPQA